MLNSLISDPLQTVVLSLTAILVLVIVVAALSDDEAAVLDVADAVSKPFEGLGLGIQAILEGVGNAIIAIATGIGQAIVTAVDNVTSAAAITGIIEGICSCF